MPRGERSGRLWPAVATVIGVCVGIALGNWQLGRGAEKRALKARFEAQASQPPIHVGPEMLNAADLDLRRVETRGVFDPRHAVFVDNRIHLGVPGYHVVMPLRLEGTDLHVLVNRGWIARPALRSQLPSVRTASGPVAISGTAVLPGRRILELSEEVIEGQIWQNVTIERYRQGVPLRIQPFVIRQENAADDGLVRVWQAPDFGVEKHYGYAFQWFALAATLAIFYAITRFRRKPRTTP